MNEIEWGEVKDWISENLGYVALGIIDFGIIVAILKVSNSNWGSLALISVLIGLSILLAKFFKDF